jgi:hypothetical protein
MNKKNQFLLQEIAIFRLFTKVFLHFNNEKKYEKFPNSHGTPKASISIFFSFNKAEVQCQKKYFK